MAGAPDSNAFEERVREQAADWFARLRAPDGERDRAAFEAWQAADPRHADAYARLVRRWDQTAFLATTSTGRNRQLHHVAKRVRLRRHGVAAAAAAALLILVPLGLRAVDATGPALVVADYASPAGELRRLALADGSRVTLDTGTRLHAAYDGRERRLELARGRARFDVAHEARPFVVEAAGTIVVAHGTVFDVGIDASGAVRVALLRGSVEVRRSTAARAPARWLAPGQAVAVAPGRTIGPAVPLKAAEAGWVSDMLSFQGTRLDEAVAAVNRAAPGKIRIVDPEIAALRVTGAFHASDARAFAEAVTAAFGLRLAEEADGELLIARPASGPR